jgi:hypothetical protein|tara:strand:- start:344 stop:667 length:324 start_codon:yes stop_codon:yes gene_type:complete
MNCCEIRDLSIRYRNAYKTLDKNAELSEVVTLGAELIEAQYNRIDSLISRIMDWEEYADEHITTEEKYTSDMLEEAQLNVELLKKNQDNIKKVIAKAEKIKPMDWYY